MSEIQVITETTDKLTELFETSLNRYFDELKKHFQPTEPPEYLTRIEVKNMLKVDISTMHNWVKRGKLKAYRLGNRVYFKRHEIEDAMTLTK